MDLREILEQIREWPPWITYAALFFGAYVEYVFPPFPGDTVVVAGAVLVTAFGWNLWPVLALVTAGAVLGALTDWALGRWLFRTGRLERLRPSWREAIDGIARQFARRGAWYLAVNRFVPGIRAFFFVAAGIAGLRWRAVVLWSGLSALLWNALLLQVGFLLGDNIDEIDTLLARYTQVVWVVIALVLAFVVYRFVRARRLRSRQEESSRSRTDRSDQR
ncbi:MAG: DedA family protein [Deltaproteobacteria bacterium]|nr:MAG: DedA family protein [Deltaproteobacteria bacterium]